MKKIKVFWGEERLKDIYPYATRWEVIKFRIRKFLKKLLKVVLFIALITVITMYVRWAYPTNVYNVREVITQVDTLTPKIKELKREVLDTLQSCESNGSNEEDGLIVYDSNKVASIGQFQFQKKTVIGYYKALYNKDITGKEAIIIALTTNDARQLAEDIIFSNLQNDKGIDNWYNCNKKHSLSSKIAFINKLSK
jgi:hypothetical protein